MVKEQVLDLLVLDAEALGHILHCRLQFAVAAAELFLKQRCILRVGAFHAHGMEKLFFMFEHTRNTPLSVFHDLVCAADGGGIR